MENTHYERSMHGTLELFDMLIVTAYCMYVDGERFNVKKTERPWTLGTDLAAYLFWACKWVPERTNQKAN